MPKIINTKYRYGITSISLLIQLLICLSLSIGQPAFAKNSQQANEFISAYKALEKGRSYNIDHLKNYILFPYLEYQRIKKNIKTTSDKELIQFIHSNKNNWMGSDINTELLESLAKKKQWANILKYHQKENSGIKATCIGLEAKIRTQPTQTLLAQGVKLWKSGSRRPNNCNPLFNMLKEKGLITDQIAWDRITLTMNKGKTTLSNDLKNNLNEPSLVSLWTKLRKNPNKHLNNKRLKKNDPRSKQLIAYGIKRIARKDTTTAINKWKKAQQQHAFNKIIKADVESYIGVRDAKDHKQSSLQIFAEIPASLRTEDANIWMARTALRYGDWNKLRSAIKSMSAKNQSKDRWQYWLAHSNKKLGKQNISSELQAVAKSASFYGFLAADELKAPYARLLQKERDWSALTPRIKNIETIKRATELFNIGLPDLAKKDWKWAMKSLSKEDQLIAAAYALEINQPFQAIITVSGTKDWNQTGLRFPLKYKDLVLKSAQKNGVIPAWVYGIMRRESAFDPIIKSSANARGLMQVLPSTAKDVARSLGIRHKTSDLMIPEKNVNLGAAYLSQMLKRFKGNYIKATAAYNAGPHRIPRWLPNQTISAPRWIESIPFDETRNYVRAVMSYTTIYDHKLNNKKQTNKRLSQRLSSIGPE